MDLHGGIWAGAVDGTVKILELTSQRRQAGASQMVLSVRQILACSSPVADSSGASSCLQHAHDMWSQGAMMILYEISKRSALVCRLT